MQDYHILQLLGSVLNGFGQLLVLLACIVLVIRLPRLPSILMLIGSALGIILWLVSVFGISLMNRMSSMAYINIHGALSILGGVAYLTFASGLVLLVIDRSNLAGIGNR